MLRLLRLLLLVVVMLSVGVVANRRPSWCALAVRSDVREERTLCHGPNDRGKDLRGDAVQFVHKWYT